MEIQEIISFILIGLIAGTVGGVLGVGGGIIMVPAMVLLFGFTQHQAQGTSLAVLTLPVAFLSAYNYYKEGFINFKVALILAATFFIGGYLGSKLAVQLPAKTLSKIFGCFMLIVSIKMILGK